MLWEVNSLSGDCQKFKQLLRQERPTPGRPALSGHTVQMLLRLNSADDELIGRQTSVLRSAGRQCAGQRIHARPRDVVAGKRVGGTGRVDLYQARGRIDERENVGLDETRASGPDHWGRRTLRSAAARWLQSSRFHRVGRSHRPGYRVSLGAQNPVTRRRWLQNESSPQPARRWSWSWFATCRGPWCGSGRFLRHRRQSRSHRPAESASSELRAATFLESAGSRHKRFYKTQRDRASRWSDPPGRGGRFQTTLPPDSVYRL